jgi:Rrf2 family protein
MITRTTHFAMAAHVLAALAAVGDRRVTSKELTFTVVTNPAFLRVVLGRLGAAGLVESRMGRRGGTKLTRPPCQITLLDVYRAIEGQGHMAVHDCSVTECRLGKSIPEILEQVGAGVDHAIAHELRRTTIADIADRGLGAEQWPIAFESADTATQGPPTGASS